MVLRDLFITTTVSAKKLAKRQVYIDAYSLCGIVHIELISEYILPFVHRQVVFPVWHGWVTGIPWHGLIIFSDQQRVDFYTFHSQQKSASCDDKWLI